MRRAANASGDLAATKGDLILARAFGLIGAFGAERHLGEFLDLVEVTAERAIALGDPSSPSIEEDELRLLAAVGATQAGFDAESADGLAYWLPPSGVRLAASPLKAYAEALKAQGVALRRTYGVLAGPDRNVPMSMAKSRTLH